MALGNFQVGNYSNKTSTANINAKDGCLLGFFVNSTSTGTIQFYDSATTTTTTPITGVITPAAGNYYILPVAYSNGLYAVIANTLNVTIVWL